MTHVDFIWGVNYNTGQLEKINSDQRKCETELGKLLRKLKSEYYVFIISDENIELFEPEELIDIESGESDREFLTNKEICSIFINK